MSCFYCGKRVSLVRKRSDADFCCDDHREKYHARTLRTIETLRAADEQIAATRRLNEGMPMRGNGPLRGRDPESLLQKNAGSPVRFGWMATKLPVSRRSTPNAHFPAAALCAMDAEPRRNGSVPPPVAERMAWSIGHVQEGPRPPRSFRVSIQLPQGGPKRTSVKHAACDRPRRLQTVATVEVGAGARAIARRIAKRPAAAKSIDGAIRAIRPPEPVQPPPPSPPITVTLRHPAMAVALGRPRRPAALAMRMPESSAAGIRSIPPSPGVRPPAPAYVPIERHHFAIPGTQISGAGVPRLGEMRWGNRSIPFPDGFRRRQFYSWEALERFCEMSFGSIAGYRPEVRIVAAPGTVATVDVPREWTAPRQDPATAEPEPRRPAPPFADNVSLPGAMRPHGIAGLWEAAPGQAVLHALDSRCQLSAALDWDGFTELSPQPRQGSMRISDARWPSGCAEAFAIPAWARPQTRSSKRTACHFSIGVRKPVFTGPEFLAGERRAGPSPAKPMSPPTFEPDGVTLRSEAVVPLRAVLLPETQLRERLLEQSEILASACRPPVGRIRADRTVYPAYTIPLGLAKPVNSIRPADAGGLRIYPPARLSGTSFDIPQGRPRLQEIERLQRLRRRGYEAMRSRQIAACWPAPKVPGLAALPANRPCAHPSRQPSAEAREAMFRPHGLPSPDAFRLSCTVMDWQLLAGAMPGPTDWGRAPRVITVPMPLDLVLPFDDLGPIRDWGMTPPAEPEKPPEPVHEDFAAGLANWTLTNPDWRQDIAGVRTGSLALLKPSLGMTDYEFEFLCKIENRSISWVFRAASTNHYHAAQIALDPASGGAHLARFPVLAGERGQPAISPLDLPLGRSSSCRVKMSVLGNEFKLFLNDKPACSWIDDRLPEGGVGFFSEGEDRARLYWVKVTPYYEGRAVDAYPPIAPPVTEIHREMRLGVRNEQRANTIGSWPGDAAAGSAG